MRPRRADYRRSGEGPVRRSASPSSHSTCVRGGAMVANGANRRWRTPFGRCLAAATVLSAVSLGGWAIEQVSAGTGGMSQGCALANSGELNGFLVGGSVSVEFFQGETLIVHSGEPVSGPPTGTELQVNAVVVDSGGFPATLSYTFPADGTYGILWRVFTDVATFTLTCTPAPPTTTTTTPSTTTTTTDDHAVDEGRPRWRRPRPPRRRPRRWHRRRRRRRPRRRRAGSHDHHVRGDDHHRGVADHRRRHDRRAAAQHRDPSPDRQQRKRQHDRHRPARPLGRSTGTADRPAPGQLVGPERPATSSSLTRRRKRRLRASGSCAATHASPGPPANDIVRRPSPGALGVKCPGCGSACGTVDAVLSRG